MIELYSGPIWKIFWNTASQITLTRLNNQILYVVAYDFGLSGRISYSFYDVSLGEVQCR